ncbi:MAG TPA: NAD+ synthase [Candidatus Kapabacteria bacterium]|nr:NAD+ synthase [Candidatus Kapabacteria bacterium]
MNEAVQKKLCIDPALIKSVLTGFLASETHRIGITKAVIGLSGGIDSAVSAFLAAEALGKENVYCVMMPYRTSSPDSLKDAQEVVKKLGVHSEVVEITPMVEPLFEKFPDMDNVRKGNIMARERMIVLYDVSAREHALVIGTGNKTESLLGYTTIFGDNACAVNPVGDLYKTQLRQLAAFMGVPEKIIKKAPSADLWVGQTDEGEIGITYETADEILYLMVDERRTQKEIVEQGYDQDLVKKIARIVRVNQFKRRPPVIGKISTRTVNVDFRYARDWGS